MDNKNKFKERRKELKLTLTEVAELVGVSYTTILRWENGEISNMRSDKIYLYAKSLQVDPIWIMGLNVPDNNNQEKKILLEKINNILINLDCDEVNFIHNSINLAIGISKKDQDQILCYLSFLKNQNNSK